MPALRIGDFGGGIIGILFGGLFNRGGEIPPPQYNIPFPGEFTPGPEETGGYGELPIPFPPPSIPESPTPPAPSPPGPIPPDIPQTPTPQPSPAPQPIGGGWQVDPALAAYAILRRTRRPSKRKRKRADSVGIASSYLLGFVGPRPVAPPVEIPPPRRFDQPFPIGPIIRPRVLPRRRHTEPGIGPPGHVPLPRGPDIRPGRRDSPWPLPLPGEQIPPPRPRRTAPGTTSPPGPYPSIPGITIPPPEIQLPRPSTRPSSPPSPVLQPPRPPASTPRPPTTAPGQVQIGLPTVQNPLLRRFFPIIRRRKSGDVSPILRQAVAPPAQFLDRFGDEIPTALDPLTVLTSSPVASLQATTQAQKRKQCEECEEEREEEKKRNARPSSVVAKVREFGRRMSQNSLDNLR